MRLPCAAFLFAVFLSILLGPCAAAAHPHAFIDLKTTLVADAGGAVTAIKEHWLFDQYYTEFALHDFAYEQGGALNQGKLLELARENLKNLKDFHYFTRFDDPSIVTGDATAIGSRLEDGRIALEFTLPLAKPAKPPFGVRIYDPSYYTAMLHVPDGAALAGPAPKGCAVRLIKPNPNVVWVNLASALDRNAKAPDDLGTYFAEKVSLTCP